MNEFCTNEIRPKARKAYITKRTITSAPRVPTSRATTRGRLGCPACNPGMKIHAPNTRPAHFNHGKRRSSGDGLGNTEKNKLKNGNSIPKNAARNANINARTAGENSPGTTRSGAAANAQNSKARSHAVGSSNFRNNTANPTRRNGMGNNPMTSKADVLARLSPALFSDLFARKNPCRTSGLGSPGRSTVKATGSPGCPRT